MNMMMMMMQLMDIEIWFDEIDTEDEIEYPLIRSPDTIWTPLENKN